MAKRKYIYWQPDSEAPENLIPIPETPARKRRIERLQANFGDKIPRTRDGMMNASVHYLVGYNQGSIADFLDMAAVIQETFPEATLDEIKGGRVTKSSDCYGFTIVAWHGRIPRRPYKGWYSYPNAKIDYCW